MNPTLFFLLNFHIITESLPISSSGHMYLLSDLLKSKFYPFTNGLKRFLTEEEEIFLHLPTLSIITLFITLHFYSWTGLSLREFIRSWAIPLGVTTGITGSMYLLTDKRLLKRFPLSLGFFITGLLLMSLSFIEPGSDTKPSVGQAVLLGIAQGCALLPGVSRLASTYTTGVALSLDPSISLLFSLSSEALLILAALAKAVLTLKKKGERITLERLSFLQGIALVGSSILSYASLKYIAGLALEHRSFPFALYMLILSLVVLVVDKNKKQ